MVGKVDGAQRRGGVEVGGCLRHEIEDRVDQFDRRVRGSMVVRAVCDGTDLEGQF